MGLAEQAGWRFGPNVKDKTWMEGKVTTSRNASLHLKYFDSYLGGKKPLFIYQFKRKLTSQKGQGSGEVRSLNLLHVHTDLHAVI